jgi:hypothetical protein
METIPKMEYLKNVIAEGGQSSWDICIGDN